MIAGWYEQQTGNKAWRAPRRIERISGQLARWGLGVAEVRLVQHTDRWWSTRRNRTELERLAVSIGYTNGVWKGYCKERWWLVPLVAPKGAA